MIPLLFLDNLTALTSSFPFCDFSIQMQSWLGTFNPERERRKVMSFLATACLSTHTNVDTQSVRIRVCAGLTLLVTLHLCETAGSTLTL